MPNPTGKSKAAKSKVFFQYKLGLEETLSYHTTGAGVNLMMINQISFLLNAEKEADGCVQHCSCFVFFSN